MKKKETYKEKCEFTVHPCSFKIKIKQIKPFYVCACKFIMLDLKVITRSNAKSCIKLKLRPRYGKVYLLGASTIIYKSTKRVSGFDIFQLLIENEHGIRSTESILIRII